jgi:hypothetical protein
MISHLYRFRPVHAVLDKYEELAKQEIYFSPPEELNDPIEGFRAASTPSLIGLIRSCGTKIAPYTKNL